MVPAVLLPPVPVRLINAGGVVSDTRTLATLRTFTLKTAILLRGMLTSNFGVQVVVLPSRLWS